jgi:sulfite reductase (NADPH) flavoprotein alpha-component
MSQSDTIPCLPENAPFTPEQRAYLNGFLAGLFSRMPAPKGISPALPAEKLVPLSILYGSQTGNAESLAKRIAREAGKRGFAATVHELNKFPIAQLASEERVLFVTSTFGDGEPPDNARSFWESLNSPSAPKLAQTQVSVCALGDSNYPKFCAFGRELDARLGTLGAQRAHPRADCDVEFEEPFANWLNEALAKMAARSPVSQPATSSPEKTTADAGPPKYSRSNPFPATLLTSRKLNGPGSEKDTRHVELALHNSELSYSVGDALGIFPENCPELVTEILATLKFSGDEIVTGREGTQITMREALSGHYEITKISQPFLKAMADASRDDLLQSLTAPDVNGELAQFLRGREIIDLLLAHPAVKFAPTVFVKLLKKLQPRLYSISSSPKAHPGQVHLTVGVVRYDSLARRRKGVCSTFLAERAATAAPLPVFVHQNKNFRPPPHGDIPMIMIGPGTGIAPFRAFLEERRAVGAKGKNWLFFGDQRAATDFIYRDELETMRRDGLLSKLDLAFSRDQAEKIYVQHRMHENAKELFDWLEQGAHVYVCGDANRMAKDVNEALHGVVQTARGVTREKAAEYMARVKAENRYQRDVY